MTAGVTDPASPPPVSAQPPSIPPEFLKKLAEAEEMKKAAEKAVAGEAVPQLVEQ